jgi:rhodanese-related sulfurtransferase
MLQKPPFCLHITAFVLLVAYGTANAAEHTTDSLDTVRENVAGQKAVLVDVRETLEWTAGHVAGAISVPISAIERKKIDPSLLERLPKDRILYTYCLVGMRSKKAAGILEQQGFTVRALKPGYEELLKAGFQGAKGE